MKTKLIATALVLLVAATHAEAQGRRGSIYSHRDGPFGLVANKTAAKPGDLVTILIQETTDVLEEERANFKRETDLSYSLDSFNIKPDAFSDADKDLGVRHVQPMGEMRIKKRHLQWVLLVLRLSPAQKLMRRECVHDAAVIAEIERETKALAQLLQPCAVLSGLFRGGAVLLRQVLGQVLTFGGNVRVQLKRMSAHVSPGAGQPQGLFQLLEADDAPRAHDVRHDVDLNNRAVFR